MTNDKRERAPHRAIHLGAVAILGLALAGCGGSQGSASAATSAAQSAAPVQSSVPAPAPGPAQSPTSAQGSTTTQSPSTGGSTSTASSGSGTPTSNPPTASTGNVTLNWVPPTENTDGTSLTNLAGYDIHYGTASGQYTQKITINNPGIATYVVSNLSPGTYYFSVSAVNSQGTESPLSSEATATVN